MVFHAANLVKVIININNIVISIIYLHMWEIKFDKARNYNCRARQHYFLAKINS